MRGYIALISILIISAVLLLIALSSGQLGTGWTKMMIQKIQAAKSGYLAQSCAEEALMKIAENPAYAGSETVNLNGKTCQILAIENLGGQGRRIKTVSNADNQTKRVKIEISQISPKITVSLWQEVSAF